jgi:hypothetical protein
MASPFQQQSLQRKLIYIGAILVLFTGSFILRRSVVAQAEALALREESRGDVSLSDAAIRWNLTGARGLVTCIFWFTAIEEQKKNQWNELERTVRDLTTLQPHFITAWLFQSWNLSYNVSVESNRESDQYFYISRGINLLAEGERKNRNHPDLRFSMAFYNQNKIMQSDKTVVLRSLYQMSCIPPNERDPLRFYRDDGGGQQVIDLNELEDFCRNHPQLIRRLREDLKMTKPEEMVQFLEENYTLPGLYVEHTVEERRRKEPDKLAPELSRFPILPPKRKVEPPQEVFYEKEITADDVDRLRDDFNGYVCARAWYGYAQEPVPPTGEFPGKEKPIEDRTKQRRPRFTTAIFRNYPCRAQSYVAEELEHEGWFDTTGWRIPEWFSHVDSTGARKDQFANGEPPVVGTDRNWAAEAWTLAHELWEKTGRLNKLYLSPLEEAQYKRDTDFFVREYDLREHSPPVPLNPEREEKRSAAEKKQMEDSRHAYEYLFWYFHYRGLCNFEHFYLRSQIEAEPETIAARKAFHEARQLYRLGRSVDALSKYDTPVAKDPDGKPIGALTYWRQLMVNERFGADSGIDDDTYIVQLRYLRLVQERRGVEFKQAQALYQFLGEAAAGGMPGWSSVQQFTESYLMPQAMIEGPFDGKTITGKDIIDQATRRSVHQRLGIGVQRSESAPPPIGPPPQPGAEPPAPK